MTYEVIARRWRPQDFDRLIGQDHVRTTLLNALKNHRLHQVLLLTGPRGTGKTSTARILAKSLRCPNIIDFVPCHTCRECEDIMSGRSIDVLEIDGASHNGVDAVRELREAVQFLPASGGHKVFIIDEVHMLSTSAFNALLKTLEEPPAHAQFIMATTEAHKIPNTILSRCQRFDFRRIPTRTIAAHLTTICEQDKFRFENEAMWIIARQADGSMRDAQSLLDQVINFSNGKLTVLDVGESLGLTDRPTLLQLFEGVVTGSMPVTLKAIEALILRATDPKLLLNDFMELVKAAVVLKSTKSSTLVDLPDSEQERIRELTAQLNEADLHLYFDMALKGAQDLARASDAQMTLEMICLRMTTAPRYWASADADTRSTATPRGAQSSSAPTDQKFRELVDKVKKLNGLIGAQLENCVLSQTDGKSLTLGVAPQHKFLFDKLNQPDFRKKIVNYITNFWGPGYSIQLKLLDASNNALSPQQMQLKDKEDKATLTRQAVEAHPLVQSVQAQFKTEIKSIKEIKS